MKKSISSILWLIALLYAAVLLGSYIFPQVITRIIYILASVALPFIFTVIHGWSRYGMRNILFFIIVCLIVSNSFENLSIMTGFPFGNYHYSDNLGAKIFYVPYIIGFAYLAMGYLSWVVAQVLLGSYKPALHGLSIFFVPLIASFCMSSWDFTFDPDSSTINHDWIWENGGGYSGVPFSNFLGWLFCVFTFFQIFAFYISKRPQSEFNKIPQSKSFWYQGIFFYSLYGVNAVLKRYFLENRSVTDQTGKTWFTGDIFDTIALASIFSMLFISILSFARVKQEEF